MSENNQKVIQPIPELEPEEVQPEPEKKTEPVKIERKFDPEKIARKKEKAREYNKTYRKNLKVRAENGDEKAIEITKKNDAKLRSWSVKHMEEVKKERQEYKQYRENEAEEKKKIIEEADRKLEALKNIKIPVEIPQTDFVPKEKYRKLKHRVNELEYMVETNMPKPRYRQATFDTLFGN